MSRSAYLIVLLGLLSGCAPMYIDSARDQFGVSTARPDASATPPSAEQLNALDTKGHEICTTGTEAQPPTIQPAQNDQQIVNQDLRCGHYDHINFDYSNVDWGNIL